LSLETNEGVAGAILNIEQYDLGLDYLHRYPGLINEITPADVQMAAQKWFSADDLFVGIAGPPPEAMEAGAQPVPPTSA
jgi:zinc protease